MSRSERVKAEVVAELRQKKIKLWLSPYICEDGSSPSRAALENLADSLTSGKENREQFYVAIVELQTHAMEKLLAKKKLKENGCQLELTILGLQEDDTSLAPDTAELPKTAKWANRVKIVPERNLIKFYQINHELAMDKFVEDLLGFLKIHSLRLVYKGKCISGRTNGARLSHIVATSNSSVPAKMLCLISYKKEDISNNLLISSIRRAATKVGINFEVTDQHGKNVAMLPYERQAFLTALGLHRLGRKQTDLKSSLVFLLEADKEWGTIAPRWRDKVDNYGLLQLDIAWIYLKLESIENLDDISARLEVAETVLRKQVDSNFVTLAIVQSDMRNPVPPLAAVFCRLFLLQGVAFRFAGNATKSKQRLDWAHGLCQSLRSVSSEKSIQGLCEAIGASEFQVISALRRTNGNSDQAAAMIEQEDEDTSRQEGLRRQQHSFGLCENKMDHVNIDLVPQVQTFLGLASNSQASRQSDTRDSNYLIAVGLLRLSNNDMQICIDICQDVERNPEEILARVAILDDELQKAGLEGSKKRKSRKVERQVDEIALATLISMGVEESDAKTALDNSKDNVETALLWLTSRSEEPEDVTARAPMEESGNVTSTVAVATLDEYAIERVIDSAPNEVATYKRMKSKDNQDDELTVDEILAETELKASLQEHDLEKDYFGSKLDEEWSFLERFRATAD